MFNLRKRARGTESSRSSDASFTRLPLTPTPLSELLSRPGVNIIRPSLPPAKMDSETSIESLRRVGEITSFSGRLLAVDYSKSTLTVLSFSQGVQTHSSVVPFSAAKSRGIRGLSTRRQTSRMLSALSNGIRRSSGRTTISKSSGSRDSKGLAYLIQLSLRYLELLERDW